MELPHTPGKRNGKAFTLLEILVSLAVMILLTALLAQITNGTGQSMRTSRSRLEADQEARTVFDRIGNDLAAMVKDRGVDSIFSKQDGNDKLFFFSEVPGYDTTLSTDAKSSFSLVAYRVNSSAVSPKLERIAKALTWSSSSAASTMPFLISGTNSFSPLEETTIAGNLAWQGLVGTGPNYDGSDSGFSILSSFVIRMEFCYLLRDGTYSNKPVTSATGVVNNLTASTAPTTADGSPSYSPGSRWYNTTDHRGYICIDASAGNAVWSPLGMDDVSNIIVAIVLIDPKALSGVSSLSQAISSFPDPTDADLSASPPKLMAAQWNAIRNASTFPQNAGLTKTAASSVYIYQRHFSITPQ